MKKLLIASLFLLAYNITLAGDPKTERLKQLVKPGNRVFITATNEKAKRHTKKLLKHECWTIVSNADSADFVLKVYEKMTFLDYFAYAAIIDPTTKEELYRTPTTNTLMRMTFSAKKAAVKKLIKRKVIPMCAPSFIENLEYGNSSF